MSKSGREVRAWLRANEVQGFSETYGKNMVGNRLTFSLKRGDRHSSLRSEEVQMGDPNREVNNLTFSNESINGTALGLQIAPPT